MIRCLVVDDEPLALDILEDYIKKVPFLTLVKTTTSAIEGEALNLDAVRSSIARRLGVDIGALAPTDRNVDGVVDMVLDATQQHAQPLTAERRA